MKFIRDLFTEIDGKTWDLNRVLFAVSVLTFIGLAVMAVAFHGQHFDWLEAGGGFAAVLAAGSGGLAMNRKNQNGASPTGGADERG